MANKTHIVRNNSSDGTKTKTLRLRYTLNGKKPAISLGRVPMKLARACRNQKSDQ